ncbi:MAG: hypothetical protein ABIW58_07340 [Sphingomicrobium sp.]
MVTGILRLLTLTALVLMPLWAGGAAAAPHASAASAMANHCGDGKAPVSSNTFDIHSGCSTCSALPVGDFVSVQLAVLPDAPLRISAREFTHDVVPEIATPPPKSS